jgi:hypothetical protein
MNEIDHVIENRSNEKLTIILLIKGQIGNPNKKLLFGLSTQNLKNLGNPNKEPKIQTKHGNPKKFSFFFVWISGVFVWIY